MRADLIELRDWFKRRADELCGSSVWEEVVEGRELRRVQHRLEAMIVLRKPTELDLHHERRQRLLRMRQAALAWIVVGVFGLIVTKLFFLCF